MVPNLLDTVCPTTARTRLSEHLVSAVLRQEYRLNGTPKAPLAASLALPAATGGNQSNHVTLIDNSNIRKALFTWTVSQIPGEVTPATFLTHVNEVVLPAYNISKTIVRSTATRWMAKLGFRPQEYKKSLYSDDHGRPDVVIARKKYIEDYQMYQSRSHLFGGANLNLLAQVEPEVLGKNQETVYIFHDKSTVHAKERPRLAWLLPGANQIRSKNAGQLIHISNFILETTGRLKLSSEDFEKSQEESGKKPESADAATVICPSTKDDKWWDLEQLCHQVAHKAIPIFETIHPTLQAVFVFDCSSAHGADAMSATWHIVQNMNLKPGGKQSIPQDTVIPYDDPCIPVELCGQPQTFTFDQTHPHHPGTAKEIQQILKECSLRDYYTQKSQEDHKPRLKLECDYCALSNKQKDLIKQFERLVPQAKASRYFLTQDRSIQQVLESTEAPSCSINAIQPPHGEENHSKTCCWSRILSLQSDFVSEQLLLQTIVKDSGHVCLFLPKFHCELNPIEPFWSYVKSAKRFLIGFVSLVHQLQFASSFVKSIDKSRLANKGIVTFRIGGLG
ncbi:hypothetical protein PSTG_12524 [Puccinia striiformis f. sp. tritici PST-78]|uniref:Tc1-like transposase DDE domain-containing protein n=1 Tax=Puccinia striiformis f. sp. tritici PST-78 TaxID=1165861 RepID=A0A0L0V538_9BASI|nr:hypothetical protein PSTG_12524 [Puccinia striiformis f. sp. tritici PST-78]